MATATTGGYTRALAEFAHDMRLADVPAEVKHEVLRVLVDCLGCAVGGLVTPGVQIANDLVQGERGPLEATVVGNGLVSLMPAAFANTVAINATDYDVYGPEGHVAPIAVSVALAAGEAVGASGADTLAALVAGLEVGGRVGAALRRAGMGGDRQLGATRGHCNVVFASVTAAGRLLGLTTDQMHNAFGIAGYSANVPTLRKFFDSPYVPMTKYDNLGVMSQNGIQAAQLAKRGFTGDLEVLEGEEIGFWRFAGAAGCDWDAFTRGLGREWVIPDVTYKHYPAVLYTNSMIYVVQQLIEEHQLDPARIDRIEARSSRTAEAPARAAPRHYLEAWLNSAYNIAAGAYDVRPLRSWEEPENFNRPELVALMKKVNFAPVRPGEVTSTGNYWERWAPVRVTIAAGGQIFEGGRDYHRLMTDEELVAKFDDNVTGLLPTGDAQQVLKHCWGLEKLPHLKDLTTLLGTARATPHS